MLAGDRWIFGAKLAAELIRLYASTDVDPFIHDNMESVTATAWYDRYGAKNLYMAEGRLTSVEGRCFHIPPRSITDSGQPPGARKIIDTLSRRDAVACLFLRHNKLGDEGCVELFEYLCSEEGQRHQVAGILLNANSLGNVALESIGSFLRDNKWLKELYLASVRQDILTGSDDAEFPSVERLHRRF